MRVTLKMVRDRLTVDSASVKAGVFTVRNEFFYRHGRTAEHLEAAVKAAFPGAVIVDSGEVWKPFRGSATTANSSHWFVRFTAGS